MQDLRNWGLKKNGGWEDWGSKECGTWEIVDHEMWDVEDCYPCVTSSNIIYQLYLRQCTVRCMKLKVSFY